MSETNAGLTESANEAGLDKIVEAERALAVQGSVVGDNDRGPSAKPERPSPDLVGGHAYQARGLRHAVSAAPDDLSPALIIFVHAPHSHRPTLPEQVRRVNPGVAAVSRLRPILTHRRATTAGMEQPLYPPPLLRQSTSTTLVAVPKPGVRRAAVRGRRDRRLHLPRAQPRPLPTLPARQAGRVGPARPARTRGLAGRTHGRRRRLGPAVRSRPDGRVRLTSGQRRDRLRSDKRGARLDPPRPRPSRETGRTGLRGSEAAPRARPMRPASS